MQARSMLALLTIATAASACKQDPAPSPQKEPAAEPPATGTPEAERGGDSYTLDTPKAMTAGAAQAETQTPAGEAAGAKPTPSAGSKVIGPSVRGEGFEAHLAASDSYEVGTKGSVTVVLNAVAPFHCNDKYPYKFTVEPSPQLTFPEQVVRSMNIGEQKSTMNVEFTPSAAGKHTIKGTLAFSVCTDDKCLIEKQQLSVSIDVKGAS